MSRTLLYALHRQGLFIVSALALAMFLWGPWPLVEGSLFPVTSKIHINQPVVGLDYMDFTYSYTKYRGRCVLVGVEASIDGSYVGFFSTKPSPIKVKPAGPNTSQVWRLWSPTLQGFNVVFLHKCPWEPWVVPTKAYP